MQEVKALNKRAGQLFPMLKDAVGKDGTAVIKKNIMMLFINAGRSERLLETVSFPAIPHVMYLGQQMVHVACHSMKGPCGGRSSAKFSRGSCACRGHKAEHFTAG